VRLHGRNVARLEGIAAYATRRQARETQAHGAAVPRLQVMAAKTLEDAFRGATDICAWCVRAACWAAPRTKPSHEGPVARGRRTGRRRSRLPSARPPGHRGTCGSRRAPRTARQFPADGGTAGLQRRTDAPRLRRAGLRGLRAAANYRREARAGGGGDGRRLDGPPPCRAQSPELALCLPGRPGCRRDRTCARCDSRAHEHSASIPRPFARPARCRCIT
jgi:hypothetical protein